MGNLEVLPENQSKNMNRISTEIGMQLNSLGVATISINPNKKYSGAATISVNPARHTSSWANASGEEDKNSDSSQCKTDMQKAK